MDISYDGRNQLVFLATLAAWISGWQCWLSGQLLVGYSMIFMSSSGWIVTWWFFKFSVHSVGLYCTFTLVYDQMPPKGFSSTYNRVNITLYGTHLYSIRASYSAVNQYYVWYCGVGCLLQSCCADGLHDVSWSLLTVGIPHADFSLRTTLRYHKTPAGPCFFVELTFPLIACRNIHHWAHAAVTA